MSEIVRRAAEIRALAKDCETFHDLMVKLEWPIYSVIAANDQLGLGLHALRPSKTPRVVREAQANPKPIKGKK